MCLLTFFLKRREGEIHVSGISMITLHFFMKRFDYGISEEIYLHLDKRLKMLLLVTVKFINLGRIAH